MEKKIPTESLLQYLQRTGQPIPSELLPGNDSQPFFTIRETTSATPRTPFNRRDYYKICLSSNMGRGDGRLIYNEQEIPLDQPCLLFTHPSVPASIEIMDNPISRYQAIFNKAFIEGHIPGDVQYASPLFNSSLHPVVLLTKTERDRLSMIFNEMQSLRESDYAYRWDMIRNLVQLLIHEGIRLHQQQITYAAPVRDRLVDAFMTSLNQHFPVDSAESSLGLLSPAHFADQLHVHVNYLNSVIKKHTGKTTRAIIQERVLAEARALLRNTNWNIAEIAYALGFEYPSHFNKYFKQFTNLTPLEFRNSQQPALTDSL
ncbi:response regulator transcription factor [Paraflavitalea sp. CAU 1676]|uniref:helix-turn-helix domain-containing protein n=1 Tax=Paraflavitalea sp. CAU 1676 TaxID=3032598 RepID=UPI0023D9A59E|nr:response regulator transcription factor [Paraflavitalea sp. CAU 1676]MDF2193200.1 helix-turn-helix transcriptional regulator [Paraflavitalea sp. CAU 1676]